MLRLQEGSAARILFFWCRLRLLVRVRRNHASSLCQ